MQRTGDSVIIHHGRRPAVTPRLLPSPHLPLLPEPPRQPLVFFERGFTHLTLFIVGRTTLSVREHIQAQIPAHDAVTAALQIHEARTTSVAIASRLLREQEDIPTQRGVHCVFLHEASTAALVRQPLLRLPAILYEQRRERSTVYTQGHESLTADEHGLLSLLLDEAPQWTWVFAEKQEQALSLETDGQWDIPHAVLLEAIATAVLSMLEEEL